MVAYGGYNGTINGVRWYDVGTEQGIQWYDIEGTMVWYRESNDAI